ncbi:protein YgfX [Pseudoalteromonas sp. SSDWG2]|uniref:protein YgfX n=1 Tax=Pseudoalteromonas sp. SSDWG2 TaxID=3139391 RepID=UPI003BAA95A5
MSVFSGSFANNHAKHRPVSAVFIFIYLVLLLSEPSWLWAIVSGTTLLVAYVHFRRVYTSFWPVDGHVSIKANRAKICWGNNELSAVILPQSSVHSGLVHLKLKDDVSAKSHHVLIAQDAMQPELFSALARAVNAAIIYRDDVD